MDRIKRAKWAYVTLALAMVALGLCLIIFPGASLRTICCLIGVVCMVFGVIKFIGYFSRDIYGLAFQFDFALGIFALVLGILLLIHPGNLISLVQFVTGLFILIDSIFKFQTSLDAKRFGLTRWWTILLVAIVSAAAGLLLVFNPFGGAKALMVLLGVTLIAGGLQNLIVVLYTVKYRDNISHDFDIVYDE